MPSPSANTDIAAETPRFALIVVATSFISSSVLVFEIALSRVFSVLLSYHFAFAIVSLAMLGLGFGGLLLRRLRKWFPGFGYSIASLLLALTMGGSVMLVVTLPIFEQPAFSDLRLWIYFLLAIVPFFMAGAVFAGLFRSFAARSSVLYAFDMLGAALGVMASVALLDSVGGVRAALAAAVMAGAGALILTLSARRRHPVFSVAVAFIVVVALSATLAWFTKIEVPVAADGGKDLLRALRNPRDTVEIVETRWSAFGRTDLVRFRSAPELMSIYVDGAAGSAMFDISVLTGTIRNDHLSRFGAFFPFLFLKEHEKNNALVIGAGGGRDVVVALLGGVDSITAVEVNPDVVQLVTDYAAFSGGIYSGHENVEVVVQEGRNYLRSTRGRFDLIMLALPVTKSSRSIDGYSLTENYLFTVEAVEDYLSHLTPEGRIIIVSHNNAELYRLVVLALAAFENRGVAETDAMRHMYSFSPGMMPTLVIKSQPFDSLEAEARHALIHQSGFDRGSVFVPFVSQGDLRPSPRVGSDEDWNMLDEVLEGIAKSELPTTKLIDIAPVDLRPVTDDSPFFYKFEPGLPRPFGSLSILILLIVGTLTFMLVRHRRYVTSQSEVLRSVASAPQMRLFTVIFFLLGVGFMLLEVAFFQKLTLYLEHPTLALTVLLFTLLSGTGLGSLFSALVKRRLATVVIFASLITMIVTLGYAATLPTFFETGLDHGVAAALVLFPLGILLGVPFPLAVRMMDEGHLGQHVDFMWGINGIASVVGSALAMIIGIVFGFSHALHLGAFVYGAVSVLATLLRKHAVSSTTARAVRL